MMDRHEKYLFLVLTYFLFPVHPTFGMMHVLSEARQAQSTGQSKEAHREYDMQNDIRP